MDTGIILLILCAHFIADFVCQPDRWARSKSSSSWSLTKHVCVYAGVFGAIMSFVLEWTDIKFPFWPNYAMLFIPHWITDYVTSRITKKLWAEQRVHEFFVVIGFDQVLHYLALFFLLTFEPR